MKKLFSILMTTIVLVTILVVNSSPIFAFDYSVETIGDEYYFKVNNEKGLKYVLEEYSDSSDTVHIILNSYNYYLDSISISKTSNIVFELGSGITHCELNNRGFAEDSMFIIQKTAANSSISFTSQNIVLKGKHNRGDGGAIYINAEGCSVRGGHFVNCYASYGGAICINRDNCRIWDCVFEDCKSAFSGGAVHFCNYSDNGVVGDCRFSNCHHNISESVEGIFGGDTVCGDGDTIVGNIICDPGSYCSDVEFLHGELWETYKRELQRLDDLNKKKKPEPLGEYTRPFMTNYSQNTIDSNENCDVIRPDLGSSATSELGHFTITGTSDYGLGWKIDYQNPLTITSQTGYTISRIEIIVTSGDDNYEALVVDNGTKGNMLEDKDSAGNLITANHIIQIDNVDSNSITLKTNGDIYDYKTMHIQDIIVYYSENAPQNGFAGSVLFDGSLTIIVGVVGLAVGLVVGIVIGKKKDKVVNNRSNEENE